MQCLKAVVLSSPSWPHANTVHSLVISLSLPATLPLPVCRASWGAMSHELLFMSVLLLGATRRFGSLFSYTEERPSDARWASLGHPVSLPSDTGF
eukprot:1161301-Pelagomonas_calceolata.AAC.1